jgi:dienelactone hydrolase
MSYGNQSQFPSPYGPQYGRQNVSPPKKSGGMMIIGIILAIIGVIVVGTVACCGGGIFWVAQPPTVSAAARQPFAVANVPPPAFPERGAPVPFEEPGMQLFQTSLGGGSGFPPTPGQGGNIWLYLPAGQHAPQSLPCILITGAGTTLLHGLEWGELNLDGGSDEHLPYVKAGFAVVAYELDGPLDEFSEDETEMQRAYNAFRAAQAGLVNARNALEYTLAKVPEVDPKRIYTAGHSSAATTALLFAEHDNRLAGCIAFAPCIDLMARFTPVGVRAMSVLFPGAADFVVQSSPKTHESRLNCPVFLFHAEDDSNVPCQDSRDCEKRLKGLGKNVTLVTVPTGDHYDSMIEQGIPRAIDWLRQQGAVK